MKPFKLMLFIIIAFLAVCVAAVYIVIEDPLNPKQEQHIYEYSDASAQNPLKGFVPFFDPNNEIDFPHTLEYIDMPLSSIQKGYNAFNWNALEDRLNILSKRGDQACLRFYLDTPARETGIPEFLIKEGLKTYTYSDFGNGQDNKPASLCPDYKDKRLLKALVSFIKNLGHRYDGDPRIGYIQLGLYGFYGEWHCTGHDDWEADDAFLNTLANSYIQSFSKTQLMARVPVAELPKLKIGYHDDVFAEDTLPVSLGGSKRNFVQRLIDFGIENKWESAPIGGELSYNVYDKIFEENNQSYETCIKAAHPSFLLNYKIFEYIDKERENAIAAAKKIGYNFYIPNAYFKNSIKETGPISIEVNIKNDGIAPFYYNWPVKIGFFKENKPIVILNTNWDIRKVKAGAIENFTASYQAHGLKAGQYRLCICIASPLAKGKAVRFSNQSPQANGWLELGEITVRK